METKTVAVGDKVRFMPYWAENQNDDADTRRKKIVTGVVRAVNEAHLLFFCEYEKNGMSFCEAFKFQDIGNAVWKVKK